ncbi:NAD(P)-binding protein [Ramaria rubella]|nr:NAD(P)-binding protein [Ramaria rubella]
MFSSTDVRALPIQAAKDYPYLTLLFGLFGALSFAELTLRITTILTQIFLIPGKSLKRFGSGTGAWAVVTGASDGIGREFALQLGKAGFNIFLASRNADKLRAVATEIESSGVKTQTQAIDFSNADDPAWQSLATALANLDIGVLVNNVGRSHEMPIDFVDTLEQDMRDIIQINVNSALKITSIVLPGLLARKRGLILNLGSFSGAIPSAMLATYSGSKAFLATWSQALAKEVESKGVTVQLVNAAFVVSAMSKIRRPSISTPTAKTFVRVALRKIGVPGGSLLRPYTSTPYWAHSMLDAFITNIRWPSLIMAYMHSMHKDIRRRALKKKEREALAAKKE